MRLAGVINGRQIELERETGLHDGAKIDVQIEPHTPLGNGSAGGADFWRPPSIAQLAREQQTIRAADVGELRGDWPANEQIEDFLDELERTRF